MKKFERNRKDKEKSKSARPQGIESKTVICYYCSGKREVIRGMPCPNCQGKGLITMTTKGL